MVLTLVSCERGNSPTEISRSTDQIVYSREMKIGRTVSGKEVPAFERDGYELHEFDNGTWCVLVRCTSDPIGFLLHLLKKGGESVGLLYVLLLSRKGSNQVGRHQSPFVSRAEAAEFLHRFGDFLQGDGRHEFWMHMPDVVDVVYDHHERIWLYGDLDSIVGWVEEFGIGNWPLEAIPVPHMHRYHPAFDAQEDAVMAYWEWNTTPLQPGDGE